MSYNTESPTDAASRVDCSDPARATSEPQAYECYCGLGPACPIFGQMTTEQQQECTRDKRRMAQQYYRNGIGW